MLIVLTAGVYQGENKNTLHAASALFKQILPYICLYIKMQTVGFQTVHMHLAVCLWYSPGITHTGVGAP